MIFICFDFRLMLLSCLYIDITQRKEILYYLHSGCAITSRWTRPYRSGFRSISVLKNSAKDSRHTYKRIKCPFRNWILICKWAYLQLAFPIPVITFQNRHCIVVRSVFYMHYSGDTRRIIRIVRFKLAGAKWLLECHLLIHPFIG